MATGSPVSRRHRISAQAEPHCTVTVCRGCCCGTDTIPVVDHAAQLAALKTELASDARVRAVNCLDACEQAIVIVVQPSTTGRAAGGRPVWLGLVNDPDATATSRPGYAPEGRVSPSRPSSSICTRSGRRGGYGGPSRTERARPTRSLNGRAARQPDSRDCGRRRRRSRSAVCWSHTVWAPLLLPRPDALAASGRSYSSRVCISQLRTPCKGSRSEDRRSPTLPRPGHPCVAPGRRSSLRSSWALRATTMVDSDMRTAPTDMGRTNPIGARTPAASGTEIRL